ncbi:DNA-directed DNA polymerase [Alteripontixanthobacter maritimus]|uniref:DNA-directed DNA polymerase n=1 Tax=Alteripontixanthobacter maritimus TaxID=2161824 RepID=A0A369Q532_9SPHN|nr:DNA polymerase III subunit chi [Alteripontixanthobacter maritimus]RDC59530.1 DNA-directed DNA polymerase [Alteripontixanthobacter maritimus]
MKVDFWLLDGDPVERVVTLIADKSLAEDKRVLVVAQDAGVRKAISRSLWAHRPDRFLANGEAGQTGAARQPILLSAECEAANGAPYVILADGTWPEGADSFERAFVLFPADRKDEARAIWRSLDDREGMERSFFRQEGGRWVKAA